MPWERGGAIVRGAPWLPSEAEALSPGVRSAVFVNLLTEDNLPYYTGALVTALGAAGAWGEWAHRWTAEEGRHSIVLRDWVTVSRLLDPVALERARMKQVSGGVAPEPWSEAGTLVYVAFQELATRVAHFNTAKAVGDPVGYEIMKRGPRLTKTSTTCSTVTFPAPPSNSCPPRWCLLSTGSPGTLRCQGRESSASASTLPP